MLKKILSPTLKYENFKVGDKILSKFKVGDKILSKFKVGDKILFNVGDKKFLRLETKNFNHRKFEIRLGTIATKSK